MAYQSLYRRYRSGKFDELVGQQHVVTALKNAITEDRVGHAYLFSGPRGTGKTSTARILGKALNCTDLGDDGEPCCVCDSCVSFESGTSYDLQELDAASNNGVEAIRDLISKVALGSPGRTKVYILDEVHMLTAGAENALLKTLEEPPDHVVFVLATTEPHKVVPTIRSRTQHYEFELIPAAELGEHVRFVADDAGLDVDDEMIDYVLRVGGGSARDTLSALDQVVAAGGVPRDGDVVDEVMAGLVAADPAMVVAAVSDALKAGREPRVIGEAMLSRLRDAFLASMGASVDHLPDTQRATARTTADAIGPAAITRALETIGTCLIDMRQAPDPRVDLEVALLRLSRPDLDTDVKALVARIERLEQGGLVAAAPSAVAPVAPSRVEADGASPAGHPAVAPQMETDQSQAPSRPEQTDESQGTNEAADAPAARPAAAPRPAAEARAALAATMGREAAPEAAPPAPTPEAAPAAPAYESPAPAVPGPRATLGARRGSAKGVEAPAGDNAAAMGDTPPAGETDVSSSEPAAAAEGPPPREPDTPDPQQLEQAGGDQPSQAPSGPSSAPSVDQLEAAWDEVKATLPGRAKSRFSGGRFIVAQGDGVVFGLPNAIHRDRCQECVDDVSTALSAHFGVGITVQLIVDGDAPPPLARAADQAPQKSAADDVREEETVDMDSLTNAAANAAGGIDLLTEAFPGAEVLDPEPD